MLPESWKAKNRGYAVPSRSDHTETTIGGIDHLKIDHLTSGRIPPSALGDSQDVATEDERPMAVKQAWESLPKILPHLPHRQGSSKAKQLSHQNKEKSLSHEREKVVHHVALREKRAGKRRVEICGPSDVIGRAHFFFQYLGACRQWTPRTRVDLKVPNDASHRDFSDANLRFDLALGVAIGMPRKVVRNRSALRAYRISV